MPIRRIALTGGIATGKSYVANQLREAGVPLVDADVLAREVVAPGTPGLAAVRQRFGPDAVRRRRHDGPGPHRPDRLQGQARAPGPRGHHPPRRAARDRTVSSTSCPRSTPFAVADIPLLFETEREGQFTSVVVVACPREMQIERVMTRNKLTPGRRRAAAGGAAADRSEGQEGQPRHHDRWVVRRDRRAGQGADRGVIQPTKSAYSAYSS